ncbi:MAG TPA: aspartate carbamoyltransferase [Anaerolineae bacterium]|nr:aspartate carbamoyltransferase [Anaerolineae bacterium]
MSNPLAGRDLISIADLSTAEIRAVLDRARVYEDALGAGRSLKLLDGRILATLFYEPSTRTRLSFESAMQRLGGSVLSVAEAKTSSSAAKGETLFDTGRMIEGYADVAVIRNPLVGSARELAEGAAIPVINGGDGVGEHPTQALLDLYTIEREKGTIDGLHIALVGDLKNGRTVHSLAQALSRFEVELTFVAPEALRMPAEVTAGLNTNGARVSESSDLARALQQADVAYITRIQKERFADLAEYEALKGAYVVDRKLVEASNPDVRILHPLPRVDEIARDTDAMTNAAYFRQARNGVYVRMALLAMLLDAV